MPPAAPPPISSHLVFMPFVGGPGRVAAPQEVASMRVACSPSCTEADCEEVLFAAAFRSPSCVMFTSFLSAATRTVPVVSVTSNCVRSLEIGSTRMQFTCTLIMVDVPTDTLPCSRPRDVPSYFTIDSGRIRTADPVASSSATNPGLVSNTSPGKMEIESATSAPFTHTPPLLCTTADGASSAISESGKRTTNVHDMKVRKNTRRPVGNFPMNPVKMLAGANRMVYWLSGCAPDKHFGASHLPYRERSISGILAGRCCEGCPVNMQANPTPNPAIEIRDVSYVLPNGETLLSGLNLRVERGETLVLLGRSGSGKTTTLKLINRLLTPASGDVLVNGKSTAESDVIRLRRSIGYVIQDVGLFPHYTVERNIGIAPQLEGWAPREFSAESKSCCSWSDSKPVCASVIRINSQAGSGSESASRGLWLQIRRSCSWTNLSERSTL